MDGWRSGRLTFRVNPGKMLLVLIGELPVVSSAQSDSNIYGQNVVRI